MRSRRTLGAVVAVMLALAACTSCGEDFDPDVRSGKKPAPLAAIYDLLVEYPDLEFPALGSKGLVLDVTLELEPDPNAPAPGILNGTATIREARVGGVARPFDPAAPLHVSGTARRGQIDLLPFGPVMVGTQTLWVDLIGTVDPDARGLNGIALFSNVATQGSWFGIKQRRYLVAASDFGLQGTITVITVRFGNTDDESFEVKRDVELISGDPVAASSGTLPMVANRLFFDNIQVLDRDRDFLTALQFSTGNGSNPHDVLAAAPGKVYITRYEPGFDDLLIADPGTGATLGTLPLGALATNGSGTARPDRLVKAGGLVLVTLQNIDASFTEYGPGLVAFIDPNTDSLISSITLAGQNPFGPPSVHPVTGQVFLADAGIFPGLLPQTLSGGIEVIDPVTMTTLGLLVDDDDAGGNISGVAVGDTTGYAVVVDAGGTNSLVAFNPSTGDLGPVILATSVFIPEIRYDGDGYLLVAEHDFGNPGLRVLEAVTGKSVARIKLSLPPVSVAILTRDLLDLN
jgi:hypothetical protein